MFRVNCSIKFEGIGRQVSLFSREAAVGGKFGGPLKAAAPSLQRQFPSDTESIDAMSRMLLLLLGTLGTLGGAVQGNAPPNLW